MKISTSKFIDITLYKRVKKNIFINLSDGNLSDMGGALIYYHIPFDYDYVISIFSENRASYVSEISIDEMLSLAGISNDYFLTQLRFNIDKEKSNDIIAMICAEKIKNYAKGRCEQELRNDGKVYYSFQRTQYSGTGKQRVHNKVTVLDKEFISVPIKSFEVDLWQKGKSNVTN